MMSYSRSLAAWVLGLIWTLALATGAQADRLATVGTLNLPGEERGVDINGSLVVLAAGPTGIHLVDASNPTSPTLRATLDTPGTAYDVTTSGSLICVADGEAGLTVVDVANPAAPRIVSNYDTFGLVSRVKLSGTKAYLADGGGGLQIIDLKDPAHPVWAGSCSFTQSGMSTEDLALDGSRAILADGVSVHTVDLTDPVNPAVLGHVDPNYAARYLTQLDHWVFMTDFYRFYLADVTNPALPDMIGVPVLLNPITATIRSLQAAGGWLYACNGDSVIILDPADPMALVTRASGHVRAWAADLAVQGPLVYVADGQSGLTILRHEAAPCLRVTAPALGAGVEAGQPFRLKWLSEGFTGTLTIKFVNDIKTITLAQGVPASQGATGVDLTIPAAGFQSGFNEHLTLSLDDGSFTVNTAFYMYAGPDTTPPQLAVDSSGRLLQGASPLWLASGYIQDLQSGEAQVEVRLNGGAWQTARVIYRHWSLPVTLQPGNNQLELRGRDYAGNEAAGETANVYYQPDVDVTPPTLTFTTPADGQVITDAEKCVVSGTASEQGAPASGLKTVQLFTGGIWKTLTGTNAWATTVTLARGNNLFAVRALDTAGNVSNIRLRNVIFSPADTTAPTLTITEPRNNTVVYDDYQTWFRGTAHDADSGLDRVELRLNGATWRTLPGTENWGIQNQALLEGVNTIEARAVDRSGNVSPIVSVNVLYSLTRSSYRPAATLGGECGAVAVDGSRAILGEGSRLTVLDVANPKSITTLASLELGDLVCGIAVSGSLACVATTSRGMQIVDLSDPAHPRWRGGYRTGGPILGVACDGAYAYLGASGQILILDISDPEAPRLMGEPLTGLGGSSSKVGLALSGSILYHAAGGQCSVIDVSDRAAPRLLSHFLGRDGAPLAVSGNTAYVGAINGGIARYDCANPASPVMQGVYGYDATYGYNVYFNGLTVVDNLLVAADQSGRLHVADISNPAKMLDVAVYPLDGTPRAVAMGGSLAYVATATGMQVIETLKPPPPAVARTIAGFTSAERLTVDGSLAVVQDSTDTLRIFDITDRLHPAPRGVWQFKGYIETLRLVGTTLHVGLFNCADCYQILDLANPNQPVLLGRITFKSEIIIQRISIVGTRAYLASLGYLYIVDIIDPARPMLLSETQEVCKVGGLTVIGSTVYLGVTDFVNGAFKEFIRKLDVSDPTHVSTLTSIEVSAHPVDLVRDPTDESIVYAFLNSNDQLGNCGVIGCQLPELKATVYSDPLASHAQGIQLYRDRIYATTIIGYLYILRRDAQGKLNTEYTVKGLGQYCDVAVGDATWPTAYIAGGTAGLQVVDLSYQQHLDGVVGQYRAIGNVGAVVARQGMAWIARPGEVRAVDVTTPTQPCVLTTATAATDGITLRLAGNRLYLPAGAAKTVQVMDVSDPGAITPLGTIATLGLAQDVATSGSLLFVSEKSPARVEVFDCADPAHAQRLTSATLSNGGGAIALAGRTLLVSDPPLGLRLYDAGNPRRLVARSLFYGQPTVTLSGGGTPLFRPQWISVEGSRACVSEQYSGLHLLDVDDPTSPRLLAQYKMSNIFSRLRTISSGKYLMRGGALTSGLTSCIIGTVAMTSLVKGGMFDGQWLTFSPYLNPPGYVQDLALTGSRLLVAGGAGGLSVFHLDQRTSLTAEVTTLTGRVGERRPLALRVTNNTAMSWRPGDGYRLTVKSDPDHLWEGDPFIDLAADRYVDGYETRALTPWVRLPAQPGRYRLELQVEEPGQTPIGTPLVLEFIVTETGGTAARAWSAYE